MFITRKIEQTRVMGFLAHPFLNIYFWLFSHEFIAFVFVEIHHLAIIGEMFVLSVAALAVYWRYIRENIPLDFHHPASVHRQSSSDFDSPEANHSEDGNHHSPIVNQSNDLLDNSHSSSQLGGRFYQLDVTSSKVCTKRCIVHI